MGLSSQERSVEIPKIGAGEADSLQQQQREKAAPLQCPRCDSKNTKFCYYNNYSKLQPRHFCKACRRYWTEGGVLRDVPVGRSRKNKRLKTAHGASAADGINSRSSTTIAAGQQQPQLTPSGACPVAFLHEDLLHPSQLKLPAAWDCTAGGYVESVPSLDPLPPEYFAWAEEPAAIFGYRVEDMFDPFSPLSSSSSSSPLDDHARRDARLVADVDGGASSWQEGHAAGSHLRCWDEVFDMVDSELKPHGSE